MNMKNYFWMMAFSIALMFQASSSVATAQEVGGGAVAVDPVIADSAQAAVQKLGIEMMKDNFQYCLLYTSPSPRDLSTSRMPSSA